MKGFLAKATTSATRLFFAAKKTVVAHSPEILITTGTIAIVGGVVLACKETLHLEEILDKHNDKLNEIVETHETMPEVYTDVMAKHDKLVAMTRTSVELVKLYAPAATTIVFGIGCTIGAYGIMKKRNIALMAAYKTLETQFNQYRQRVIEDSGAEKDQEYMAGIKKAESDIEGTPIKKGDYVAGDFDASMYARYFDRTNPHYVNDVDENLSFINCQESTANRLLTKRGVLLLNDVYDLLGIKRSDAGAQVGWEAEGDKDNKVEFKILRVWRNAANGDIQNNFHEGYERVLLLDFNVDGIVADKFDHYGLRRKALSYGIY